MSEEIHVQVAVGIQQTPAEEEGRSTSVTIKDFKSLTVLEQNTEGKQESNFTFNCVFEQDTDQERVYNSLVKPLLTRVRLGYNVSLVVCSTSGKSKLLEGEGREEGIMCKMLDDVFTERRSEEDHRKELITFSDIQFRPDGSIVDLLSPHAREIQCLQHSVLGLVLAELSEMVVSSSEDAWSLYQQGSEARRLGGAHLDRCNTVTLERQETATACVRSCFWIFDLTGGPPGDVANGVSALENVLSEGPTQKPLEQLLHQSLRGNSCSALICCLTLPELWTGQTVSALSLAHRVTGLTNQVSRFCWDWQEVTRKLRSAIGELRKRASKTNDLCGQDVEQLGRFVQELQASGELAGVYTISQSPH
ncbi:uncharacterized protein [Hemitrygon akajei]|uniref:uncharacterized protein n=1 Tax=Hemitrygon akajei TaxID=2704970 RepID=UPI003BFA2B32